MNKQNTSIAPARPDNLPASHREVVVPELVDEYNPFSNRGNFLYHEGAVRRRDISQSVADELRAEGDHQSAMHSDSKTRKHELHRKAALWDGREYYRQHPIAHVEDALEDARKAGKEINLT